MLSETINKNDEKIIDISGTNNRYQIKKLKKEAPENKKRKALKNSAISSDFFTIEKQDYLMSSLNNNGEFSERQFVINQLETKLVGYKQQDLIKKRYNEEHFIMLPDVVYMLNECSLNCHYCGDKTFILYDLVRETKQWTLDRIDNDLGHNLGNVVIACLECNLKRRRTNKDNFLFTKQLNIIKS